MWFALWDLCCKIVKGASTFVFICANKAEDPHTLYTVQIGHLFRNRRHVASSSSCKWHDDDEWKFSIRRLFLTNDFQPQRVLFDCIYPSFEDDDLHRFIFIPDSESEYKFLCVWKSCEGQTIEPIQILFWNFEAVGATTKSNEICKVIPRSSCPTIRRKEMIVLALCLIMSMVVSMEAPKTEMPASDIEYRFVFY